VGKAEKILFICAAAQRPVWGDVATIRFAQVLLLVAALVALLAVGVYVARRFRGDTGDDRFEANHMLTKFRELHAEGELSSEEFRTIRTTLARQLRDELRDDDETGLDDRSNPRKPSG